MPKFVHFILASFLLSAWQAPAQSRAGFISVNSLRIHYERTGQGRQ
ncbi:hypothetical protein [Hymenobacter volaticus]|uniref:Uncharacterized protein n=1 Tax=Hymenobacter volaticus TaxID=2932254 RepID=A0ABY4GEE6_9BACT|nr:hypothetical protein [Hymenobacter volaticus]UOQ69218.1 hypothetical protein MUN86_27580 [Hymenobacter volaticus]